MNSLQLYGRYLAVSIRAQMQYRMSFLMAATGSFIATIIEVTAIWALFDRFGDLPNWNLAEVCFLYGVVNISFAITACMTSGFDEFGSQYIRTGNFDRLLLRPRGIVLQLLGHELALRKAGRLAQGIVVFAWGASQVQIDWSLLNMLFLLFTLVSGVAFFHGLLIFQATLAIWTVESLEVMNTMTYGGVQTAQYPMNIYSGWLQRVFTYIVPLACISYFPVLLLMDKSDPLGSSAVFQALSPTLGFIFLGASLLAFRFGISQYTSTGS
jgi:ABC-2 type transport system permease protein